jgi:ATP phosphoribosyltransferase
MSALLFGVPSKGRLQEQTFAFLADCGAPVRQDAGARGYHAEIAGLGNVSVRLLSASDIAAQLSAGELHLGVTGEDLLRELGAGLDRLSLLRPLGFGRADLVVAAPAAWLDVTHMRDLEEVAAAHRARTGARLRVATKYHRQTQDFFARHAISDYRIVESLGATEGAPAAGAAEIIVDITTTGATLLANHLRPLSDGLILRSQAQLAASRAAPWSAPALSALDLLLARMEARARGRATRLIRVAAGAVPRERIAEALSGFVVRPAEDNDGPEAAYYCPADDAFGVVQALSGIGVGPIGLFQPDYVFEPDNTVFAGFRDSLPQTGEQ